MIVSFFLGGFAMFSFRHLPFWARKHENYKVETFAQHDKSSPSYAAKDGVGKGGKGVKPWPEILQVKE